MGKSASKLARPTVLTDDVKAKILKLVSAGNYLNVACDSARFTYRTLKYWENLCEQGKKHAQVHADFFHALKAAKADAEAVSVGVIRDGEPGWQSNAWFLERRYPQRWGKKDRTPIAGQSSQTGLNFTNGDESDTGKADPKS